MGHKTSEPVKKRRKNLGASKQVTLMQKRKQKVENLMYVENFRYTVENILDYRHLPSISCIFEKFNFQAFPDF